MVHDGEWRSGFRSCAVILESTSATSLSLSFALTCALATSSPLSSDTLAVVPPSSLLQPHMDSPGHRLPWEVIERVVDHSYGRPETLKSFTLTCRQLLPGTRRVIFTHVQFNSRDHVFAFVDFLRENPHLIPVVHSITVWPPDLAPVPLLSILPNLSEIRFTPLRAGCFYVPPELGLHQSTLTCFQHFGTSIHTLHLLHVHFKTYMPFARVLSAFVHATHLVCEDVRIGETGQNNGEPPSLPETIKRWLTKRIRIRALTVSPPS